MTKVGSDSPPAMRGEGNSTESAVPDMPLSGPSDLADHSTDEHVGLRACACPPGWKHQPGCVEVTG